jgi:multidrug efflux pump subunit AcrB
MMSLMTVVLGFVSLRRLSVDLFPEINVPVIRVATFYTGAGPADIEKTITEPIERAVGASPGVDRGREPVAPGILVGQRLVQLRRRPGQRAVRGVAARGADPEHAAVGIQQPFIIKFDITNIPVVQIAVSGKAWTSGSCYDLAYNTIEPQIERINGVASANVGGGLIRELEVKVKRDALRARNLGILDVVDAVRESNLLLPSGHIKAGTRDYNVFSNTQIAKARPLSDVIVRGGAAGRGREGAAAVRVRDIAEVEDGAQINPRSCASTASAASTSAC